ncbi:MAG: AAA family ATPase [Planctomycetaceae bacterium]|jgi:predicted ATP-dependent endonuclease of OLD family|nr:AAA family ATPase [Planctomycetaceae bacterium]
MKPPNIFITKISIGKVRNLRNIEIPIIDNRNASKHLIITGKNGSGKTSLLEAASEFLSEKTNSKFELQLQTNIPLPSLRSKEFIRLFVPAQREIRFKATKNIEKILSVGSGIKPISNSQFIKYLVYWNYQKMVGENGNQERHEKIVHIKQWFDNFLKVLREVYDCPKLTLEHDSENLNFIIHIPNYPPFCLNEMADGYSAFLKIVMELMMRMGNPAEPHYNNSGIVLIDEIETHLHVELQKRVMPLLVKMFPNIQFIVSTHSPFVITSLDNAVVFDLEKQQPMENLSAYSYEGIIELLL